MTYATRKNPNTVNFDRNYHKQRNFVDYVIKAPPGGKRPAKGWDESGATIPNPALVAYYPPPDAPPRRPTSVPPKANNKDPPKKQQAMAIFNNKPSPRPIKAQTTRELTSDDIKIALL